ncbi:hypothetical protein ABZ299_03825 [Streptomyces sp. NPDC006184]|uniref:hypothetical protein n=1 Tax=Streptomyces sp. NPDC006184 TaxID=3155455 RepID=UPI0033BE0610
MTVTGETDHVSACRPTDEARAAVPSAARRVETYVSRVTFRDRSGPNVLPGPAATAGIPG